jgi:Ca2+-transporting ATPase
MSLVGVQLGHMFNCCSRTRSAFDGPFRNAFIWAAIAIVIALQLLAVYLAPLARVLQSVHLTSTDWIVVAISIVAPIIIVEVTKVFARRNKN